MYQNNNVPKNSDRDLDQRSLNALTERVFVNPGLRGTAGRPAPLGSNGRSYMNSELVALETELRSGAVVNNAGGRQSELNIGVWKPSLGMHPGAHTLGAEYKFK